MHCGCVAIENVKNIRGTYSTYDHAFFMAKKIFRTLQKRLKLNIW